MKTVLPSVLLGMLTMLKAEEMTSNQIFNIEQFSGFWYEVGVGANSEFFLRQKGIKRLGAAIVIPVRGYMRVKIVYDRLNRCIKEDIFGVQVDVAGEFEFSRNRRVYVVDTNYKTYAIVNIYDLQGLMNINILKLFSRTLENIDEGWKILKDISESVGISGDNVFMLIYNDTCVKMFKKVNPFVSLLSNEIDSKRETDLCSPRRWHHNDTT